MAIGERRGDRQEELWIATSDLARSPGHPFYERVNQILAERRFDEQVESPYEVVSFGQYKVRKDCHVQVHSNYYSVLQKSKRQAMPAS